MTTPQSTPPFQPISACWVCGGTKLDPAWSDPFTLADLPRFGDRARGEYPRSVVMRCKSCGFGQPRELPPWPDYFSTLYAIELSAQALQDAFQTQARDQIIHSAIARMEGLIDPQRRPQARWLDVGCHVGRLIHLARQKGWNAEGVEINPTTAGYAAQRTGAAVRALGVEALDPDDPTERFDVITMLDVLEHVPDPLPTVTRLRGLLRPGGVLMIKVPHGPPQMFKEWIRRAVLRADESTSGVMVRYVHVNHFTPKALKVMAQRCGFEPSSVVVEVAPPERAPTRLAQLGRLLVYRLAALPPPSIATRLPWAFHLFLIARARREGS